MSKLSPERYLLKGEGTVPKNALWHLTSLTLVILPPLLDTIECIVLFIKILKFQHPLHSFNRAQSLINKFFKKKCYLTTWWNFVPCGPMNVYGLKYHTTQ